MLNVFWRLLEFILKSPSHRRKGSRKASFFVFTGDVHLNKVPPLAPNPPVDKLLQVNSAHP